MGIVDKLISKYRGTANLFCESVKLEEGVPEAGGKHALVGKNCSVSVAGMSFTFDSVKVGCNEIESIGANRCEEQTTI